MCIFLSRPCLNSWKLPHIFQKRSGGKDVTGFNIATVSFWENDQMISMHENIRKILQFVFPPSLKFRPFLNPNIVSFHLARVWTLHKALLPMSMCDDLFRCHQALYGTGLSWLRERTHKNRKSYLTPWCEMWWPQEFVNRRMIWNPKYLKGKGFDGLIILIS